MYTYLKRLLPSPAQESAATGPESYAMSGETFHLATEKDLYYCYRLILQREPDPAGWASWVQRIHTDRLDLQVLTDSFLSSPEFREREAALDQPQLVELEGFRIYVRLNDFFFGAAIARDRYYEPHVTRALQHYLRPGIVFLDIGANLGYFTLMAATTVGPMGRVIAFEPNPRNRELLTRSLAANDLTNVELYPFAVSDRREVVRLATGVHDSNGRVVAAGEGGAPTGSDPWLIEAVPLDALLGDLPRLDLIKMDIEGAEPKALQGMASLLRRHRPVIVTEFNPICLDLTSGMGAGDFLDLLVRLDYDLALVPTNLTDPFQPVAPEAILAHYEQTGRSILELVATPRVRNESQTATA